MNIEGEYPPPTEEEVYEALGLRIDADGSVHTKEETPSPPTVDTVPVPRPTARLSKQSALTILFGAMIFSLFAIFLVANVNNAAEQRRERAKSVAIQTEAAYQQNLEATQQEQEARQTQEALRNQSAAMATSQVLIGMNLEEARQGVKIEEVTLFEAAYQNPLGCWEGEYYRSEIEEGSCREPELVRFVIVNDWNQLVYVEFPGGNVRDYEGPEDLVGCCASLVNFGLHELSPGRDFDVVQKVYILERYCITVRTKIVVENPWDDPFSWELCPLDYVNP